MTPPLDQRPIAVTGASGLLGRALVFHLAAKGYQVRALARTEPSSASIPPGVRCFRCDLPDGIDSDSLRGCSSIVHAAYATRYRSLADSRRTNEEGTRRLLAASRDAGIERFVFISSMSASPEARSYYGRSKLLLESTLDPARDLAIRPGLVLAGEGGLFQRMTATLRQSRLIPLFGSGRQMIQTIHIEDLCVGIGQALHLDCTGVVTLAEPDPVTMRELLEGIADRLDRRVWLIPVPIGPVLAVLRVAEKLGLRLPVSSENLLGLMSLRPVDCRSDLARVGLSPRPMAVSLDQLLRVHVPMEAPATPTRKAP